MTEKWSPGKFDLDQVTGRFQFTTFEMAGFHTEHIERKSNLPETYENKRAWVSYIFPANTIFYLETCCDTFHVHFQSGKFRVTHSNYSSTTYIDYTL